MTCLRNGTGSYFISHSNLFLKYNFTTLSTLIYFTLNIFAFPFHSSIPLPFSFSFLFSLFYSLCSLHSRVVAPFRLASSISRSTTRTDRSVHNALPRAKQNLSPKYFIPFEAIDSSIKLQEVSLKVSKRDENPIESAFNVRYKVTWVGSSSHFENEFNRVKHQLHTVLREGKNEMERNYTDSTDESTVTTQQSHTYGELLIVLKLHYNDDQGEIATERYKKRFPTSFRVKDVVEWIERLEPTFQSCKDPVVIYELRGGLMPERQLKKVKLEESQILGDIAGKSTFLPIVVDRSNMLYSE